MSAAATVTPILPLRPSYNELLKLIIMMQFAILLATIQAAQWDYN